jgi:hypothetical protein
MKSLGSRKKKKGASIQEKQQCDTGIFSGTGSGFQFAATVAVFLIRA